MRHREGWMRHGEVEGDGWVLVFKKVQASNEAVQVQ